MVIHKLYICPNITFHSAFPLSILEKENYRFIRTVGRNTTALVFVLKMRCFTERQILDIVSPLGCNPLEIYLTPEGLAAFLGSEVKTVLQLPPAKH